MSIFPFFQLYPADYLADTRHLTTEQHGAFLLLLMSAWGTGGRLPKDEKKLARMAGVTLRRWRAIGADIMEYWDEDGDEIVSQRLVKEHQKALSKSESRSAAGRRGGKAKALKDKEPTLANARKLPCHLPEPEPDIKRKKQSKKKREYTPDFESFWSAYPFSRGSPKARAFKAWEKLDDADRAAAMAALPEYHKDLKANPWKKPCYAATWLNDNRWETLGDEPKPAQPTLPPLELTDTAEHRFLRKALDAGVSEFLVRAFVNDKTLKAFYHDNQAYITVAALRQEFENGFGALMKKLNIKFISPQQAERILGTGREQSTSAQS